MKLAEHAEVIRTLGKRVVGDIIEIGRRLTEAKTPFVKADLRGRLPLDR